MEPTLAAAQIVEDAPQSGYEVVARQIAALSARFGLQESQAEVMQTYADLFGEALAFPLGNRIPGQSRINQDGTPIQYAATVGSRRPTLQFLGDAGRPGVSGLERMRAQRQCMNALAQRMQAGAALSSAGSLLDELAPETDIDLLSDHGGAYWIGAAFSAGQIPRLRIYVNSNWGKNQSRWERLSRFAAHFDQLAQWQDAAGRLMPELQPLGTAITFHGDAPAAGRIYLSAYGKRMSFYENIAEDYGGADSLHQMRLFGRHMLQEDYAYPTQTAVCSFGFGDQAGLDVKLELCAHCLFASDAEAAARLRSWFEAAQLDAADYWGLLEILSEGKLSETSNNLHSYVGLGLRAGAPYATIYLKPRLSRP